MAVPSFSMTRRVLAFAAFALLASCDGASEQPAISVDGAWALATAKGQTSSAAYLTIANEGGEDRLVSVSSPLGEASIHSTSIDDGVIRMRPLDNLEIPARSTPAPASAAPSPSSEPTASRSRAAASTASPMRSSSASPIAPTSARRLWRGWSSCATSSAEARSAFNIVFVTVDPERDGPEEVATYETAFGGPVIALTGSPAQIEQVKKQYGIFSQKAPGRWRRLYRRSHCHGCCCSTAKAVRRDHLARGAGPARARQAEADYRLGVQHTLEQPSTAAIDSGSSKSGAWPTSGTVTSSRRNRLAHLFGDLGDSKSLRSPRRSSTGFPASAWTAARRRPPRVRRPSP
jgi:hypothetical protein